MNASAVGPWARAATILLVTAAATIAATPTARATTVTMTGTAVAADPRAVLPVVKLEEVRRPTLLFADPAQPGRFYEAPLVDTAFDLDVRGVLLRGRARQTFTNPTQGHLEAVYVFPLSEGAAVDALLMRIGDRVIEGQIHEKQQAAALYETAKAEGKKASLVVQHRPNVFTTNVANIGPGEAIEIDLGWQEALRYDAGKVALRLPLVVAPRYTPAGAPLEQSLAIAQVAPRDTTPRVRIEARVEAGFPVAAMRSLHHEAWTRALGGERYVVSLAAADGEVPADRDFVLEWTAKPLLAPTAAVFTERRGDDTYALVLVVPPTAAADAPVRLPRETIFVVDTSGSMQGTSMEQARAALHTGLATLTPADAFNIVQFNSYASLLWDDARPATADALAEARRYVDRLQADGGTEMLAALQLALNGEREERRVRQVVFITDGAVSDEAALFAHIERQLGASRLFTVGIGSAPNSFFMKKAAEFGRGTFTYIATGDEVRAKMGELFGKIESPVLSHVQVGWGDAHVEAHPRRVPDLYAGEPLVVAAKLDALPESLLVEGRLLGAPWAVRIELPAPVTEPGVAKLWAHKKIEGLVDLEGHAETHRAEITALALRHHLVSKYTSLVAVDVTPTRPDGATLATTKVPAAVPHGQLPQGGTAATLTLYAGALLALLGALLALRDRAACARGGRGASSPGREA